MTFPATLRIAGCALALAASSGGAAFSLSRLESGPSGGLDGSGPVYLPKSEYLKVISLGYDNALADVLWFRTISYFGKHYRGDRTYPWLAHMCDLVTDLDPKAEHVYRFAGMVLPWEAEQVDAGLRLLEKGISVFPESWTMHYWVGFTYYFFKDDLAKASEHLRRAARLPGAHPNAARLAAVLASEHYGPETTLGFLAEIQKDAYTDEMRQVVDEHLREARLAADLERLNAGIDAYREQRSRPPSSLGALVDAGLITAIPDDPFGGVYEIDPSSGRARSSTGRSPSALHRSRLREKYLRGDSIRDF